jgi:hypothetical protein
MKVRTANEHLARILPPKSAEALEAALKKTKELRQWVEHSSDPQADKDRFDEAIARKQEELEAYWRTRKSA